MGYESYHIHVRFREFPVVFKTMDFSIEIACANIPGLVEKMAGQYPCLKRLNEGDVGPYFAWRKFYICNLLVLVDIGGIPQQGKGIDKNGIVNVYKVLSMVWLKPLNNCHVFGFYAIKPFSPHLAIPAPRIITNWELELMRKLDPSRGIGMGESKHGRIQSRPEVVNGVSHHKPSLADVLKENIGVGVKVKDMLVGLEVKFMSNRYLVKGLAYKDAEFISMISAPLNFPPCIEERMAAWYHRATANKSETQKTTEGKEIRLPNCEDFFECLKKAAIDRPLEKKSSESGGAEGKQAKE